MRGLAIALVVFHHATPYVSGGFLGVDLFFVLSGILITWLLVEEWSERGGIRLSAFYARRAFRLLPALLALVLALALLGWLGGPPQLRLGPDIWFALFYVFNLAVATGRATPMSPLGVTWSLSIEEQFYLLWPVTLRILLQKRVPRRVILAGLTAAGGLVLGLRLHLLAGEGAHGWGAFSRLYFASDTRADALLVGCLTGLLLSWRLVAEAWKTPLRVTGIAVGGLLVWEILTANATSAAYLGLPMTLVDVGFGLLLLNLLRWPGSWCLKILRSAPLRGLGKISYALYLWHWPIVLAAGGTHQTGWKALAIIGLSVGAACLSYALVERPFLKLKKAYRRIEN